MTIFFLPGDFRHIITQKNTSQEKKRVKAGSTTTTKYSLNLNKYSLDFLSAYRKDGKVKKRILGIGNG